MLIRQLWGLGRKKKRKMEKIILCILMVHPRVILRNKKAKS